MLEIKQNFEKKIENIFLSICFNIKFAFSAQKNRLIETVLLSTHNKCFGRDFFITHTHLEACITEPPHGIKLLIAYI